MRLGPNSGKEGSGVKDIGVWGLGFRVGVKDIGV